MVDYTDRTKILMLQTNPLVPGKVWMSWIGFSTLSDNDIEYTFPTALPSHYEGVVGSGRFDLSYQGTFKLDSWSSFNPVLSTVATGLLDTASDTSYRVSFADVTDILRFEHVAPTTLDAPILLNQADIQQTRGTPPVAVEGLGAQPDESTQPPPYDFAGDVFLDNDALSSLHLHASPGENGYFLVLHELTHSMGLFHTDTTNFDSQQYSVMSYLPSGWSPSGATINSMYFEPHVEGNPDKPLFAYGLGLMDLAALQESYGRNYSMRGSDTVYSMNNGFGRDGDAKKAFMYTIWDGGGTDIIDASSFLGPAKIDLRQGNFSSIGTTGKRADGQESGFDPVTGREIKNVAIAYHVIIENAKGTDLDGGHDVIIGNDWNNILWGGRGEDKIYGSGYVYSDHDHGFVGVDPNDPFDPNNSSHPDHDILIGGKDNDTLFGSLGSDLLVGGFDYSDIEDIKSGWNASGQFNGLDEFDNEQGYDIVDYSGLQNEFIRAVRTSATDNTVEKKTMLGGSEFLLGTDTLISIDKTKGTVKADAFEGAPTGTTYTYDGDAGVDKFKFAAGPDQGTVYIADVDGAIIEVANAHSITIDPGFALTFGPTIGGGGGGSYGPTVYLNTAELDSSAGAHRLNVGGVILDTVALWNWFQATGAGGAVGNATDFASLIYGYSGSNGQGNGNGIRGADSNQDGNFEYVVANPNIGGAVVPYADADLTLNPLIATSYYTTGTGYAARFETTAKEVRFVEFLAEDVRLTTTGAAGDASLVLHVDSLNKTFTISDFEAGRTISGLALYNVNMHAQVQEMGTSASLTGTDIGDFFAQYSSALNFSSSVVNLTYFVDSLRFADGILDLSDPLTFTGTSSGETLNGLDTRDDILLALGGNDTLNGLGGNDTLDGGSGADSMVGGAGNDTYVVDDAGDSVTEGSGAGTDTVQSTITYTLGSNIENLTLTGGATINGTGNTLDNIIVGNSAVNSLTGSSGNDTLDGGAAADTLNGADGNDVYVIDNAGDVVSDTTGTDTIQSYISYTLASGYENLTLLGSDYIDGTGNSAVNTIVGNIGNNTLDGASGNDTMIGGQGDDLYKVDSSSEVITEIAAEGTDSVESSASYTLSAEVENLTLTGASALNGTGNASDNNIIGTTGNNVLTGNNGNDTIDGNGGTDSLVGGAGDDVYIIDGSDTLTEGASAGTDTVYSGATYTLLTNFENLVLTGTGTINGTGNTVDNIIIGNSGVNTLNGSSGNDTLDGGAGADSLIGGTGNDIFYVDDAGDNLNEGASAGTDTVVSTVGFTLATNFENLTLIGGDAINGTGNTLANTIIGNSAVNTLDGGTGNDTLDGGAGADIMIGGTSTGNDTFIVDDAGDIVTESASGGTDIILSSVTYTISANVENLTLTGSDNINGTGTTGANTITGNSANNTLNGGGGTDTLVGGTGDDNYIIDGSDTITEAASSGNDTVESSVTYTLAANVENIILTGAGNNNGTGNTGDNTLTGNGGNNVLTGLAGNDTYIIQNTGDTAVEAASAGTDIVLSSVTFTLGVNVENLTLTGAGTINGTGNTLANTLIGNSAVNTLDGGSGNDTLDGGAGADTMIGGTSTGNDTFSVDDAGDIVTEAASGGTDTVLSSITYTLGSNVENLTLTGAAAINGTGNSLVNTLIGNSASNTLSGGLGNDTLDGGAGADSLDGGDGNDTFIVDDAGDVVSDTTGIDIVQSSVSFTLGASLENLTLTGSGNINGTGHAGANTITGNSGNNTLDGGGGTDTLVGGTGDDVYIIDGSDTITEAASSGTDTVRSSATYTLAANTENLILTGSGNINGTGTTTDNTLIGNAGNNVLTANAGNDTLDGGGGTDSLVGGTGDDIYIVDGSDTITEAASAGTDSVLSSATITLSVNVENLTLTGISAINGTGNASVNIMIGNSAVNTLDGGNGNDTLNGAAGADTMDGGANNDVFIVDDAGDVVIDSAGVDLVQSSVSYTLGTGIESLSLTGTNNINGTGNTSVNTITGNAGNNTLTGDAGADTITGGAGDDYIDGGVGVDSMAGGTGNDTYVVDSASDVVTESANEGTDTIFVSFTYSIASNANVENVTETGTLGYDLTGNALNNILTGASGANLLTGNDGNDTLIGVGGADILRGGNGNDVLDSGSGNDTAQDGGLGDDVYIYLSGLDSINETINGGGNDTLRITGGVNINNITTGQSGLDAKIYINAGSDEMTITNFHYTGANQQNYDIEKIAFDDGFITTLENHLTWTWGTTGADTITGTSGHDTILAKAGNDVLNGAAGDDDIHGGSGADTLSGGDGADLLHGGDDDDLISGQDGEDMLFGGSGADTFIFENATAWNNIDFIQDFSVAQGDKIDLRDVLSSYNPGTDILTDFVRMEDGSNNTILSVDQDGAGTAFDWVRIAALEGVTGLTDEAALVTSGNLLVA